MFEVGDWVFCNRTYDGFDMEGLYGIVDGVGRNHCRVKWYTHASHTSDSFVRIWNVPIRYLQYEKKISKPYKKGYVEFIKGQDEKRKNNNL